MQKRPPYMNRDRMWIEEKKQKKKRNPKTEITYDRQQNQWLDRDETIFMLTKEFTKDTGRMNEKKPTTTKHSPITDADNSDKIKWRNNINYLGWVQTFSHPYTKHIKHPRKNTTEQNNRPKRREVKRSEE